MWQGKLWSNLLFLIGGYRKGINISMDLTSQNNKITWVCFPLGVHPMTGLVQNLKLSVHFFFSENSFPLETWNKWLIYSHAIIQPSFSSHSASVWREAWEWLRKASDWDIFHRTLPEGVSAFSLGDFHPENCLNWTFKYDCKNLDVEFLVVSENNL